VGLVYIVRVDSLAAYIFASTHYYISLQCYHITNNIIPYNLISITTLANKIYYKTVGHLLISVGKRYKSCSVQVVFFLLHI
jgi:hypothetical protein